MLSYFILVILALGAYAEVNKQAVVSFSLIGAKRSKLDTTFVFKLASVGTENLSHNQLQQLLEYGGLSNELAKDTLKTYLPKLHEVGRSTEEQTIALLMLANKFCYRTKDETNLCYGEMKDYLSLTTFQATLGCKKENIFSWGLNRDLRTNDVSEMSDDEVCQCFDQSNPLLWLSVASRFSRKPGSKNNNQTAIILQELFEKPCEGYLKSDMVIKCTCSKTTEGHEALMMFMIASEEDIAKNLTQNSLTQSYMQDAKKQPQVRFGTDEIIQYLIQGMGSNLDPTLLAYLLRDKSTGVSSSEYLKQMMLASLGLDASLTQLFLSGDLTSSDQATKNNAFVNYLSSTGAIDPAIVPLLLKVENGKYFYLTSLIGSGAIDPFVGLILIAKENNIPNDQVLEVLIEAISNPGAEDYLDSIYSPYIPGLPAGIYPGSKLYFAHFEILGINTCALHDLRNRFECGYTGITAAECEVAPYCCFSPLFLDDAKVSSVTSGSITKASDVPWCYYNVFFVFLDTFFLEVKKPGDFASPLDCRGLFKYNLQIPSSLYTVLASRTPNPLANYMITRTECGFPGITEFQCVAIRGCCWDNVNTNIIGLTQCYQKNGGTSLGFSYSKLPAAYSPAPGSCNVNRKQIRVLYFKRTACHYGIEFYKYGYNALSVPNRLDCLTRLKCCYEDNEEVVKQYPFVPRCYNREEGKPFSNDVASLFKTGEVLNSRELPAIVKELYPPITKPKTQA